MLIFHTTGSLRTLALLTAVTYVSISHAVSEEKKPEIPKQVLSLFDDKTDTPPKRDYLSKTELYDLLSKHPVFCDGSPDSLFECTQVLFDSETTGQLRGQVRIHHGAEATIYQDAQFSLSDDGLCTNAATTDLSLEVSGQDNKEISGLSGFFSQYLYVSDYYVTADCLRFARTDASKANQGEVSLDHYESVQLINGEWKTDRDPTPTKFFNTWTMAPEAFKATTLFSGNVPSKETYNVPIAMSGHKAVLGMPWVNDGKGAAYVYDTKTGKKVSELSLEHGRSDQPFAVSVAVSENTAIVGTQGIKDSPAGAYLFDVSTGNRTSNFLVTDDKKEELVKPTYASVGISGSKAIVGFPGYIDPHGKALQPGRTVYLLDAGTGKQRIKLMPGAGTDMNAFGGAVAISGARAIVGAPYENKGSGAAYLFDTATGKQIAKLDTGDSKKGQAFFGRSVAMSGNTALIGAHGENDYQGAAYLFDTTTGKQIAKLTAGAMSGTGFFGFSVAISGNMAVVGANGMPTGDDADRYTRGSVYVFDVKTGKQISWITAGNKLSGRFFGELVGVADGNILVRSSEAPKNNEVAKKVYLFQPQ